PLSLFSYPSRHLPDLPSFPTRRSSDLPPTSADVPPACPRRREAPGMLRPPAALRTPGSGWKHRGFPACGSALRSGSWGCLHRERSEEHTSELQSLTNLVCRLLLEKKNI